jgi:hypothetical protein
MSTNETTAPQTVTGTEGDVAFTATLESSEVNDHGQTMATYALEFNGVKELHLVNVTTMALIKKPLDVLFAFNVRKAMTA